MIYNKHDFQM